MRKIVAVLILIGVGTWIGVGTAAASTSCPGLPYCDPATGISYPDGEPGGNGG
jgi:hypothetical protein